MGEMGDKAARFLEALRRLCAEHDVILAVSGYDALQVWDAQGGGGALMCNGLEDRTDRQRALREKG